MGKIIHGQKFEGNPTPEYSAWAHMMQRCYNPNDGKFKDYGARGITVCERWHESANFLEDMGPQPSAKHTLGRIKNGGIYEKANCRWETPKQQARNRRSTKLTMADAREIRMLSRKGYSQWDLAHEFDVSQANIWSILHGRSWAEHDRPQRTKGKWIS